MLWKEDIQAYRRFCEKHKDRLPLFFQEEWLKAVVAAGSYRCWVAFEHEEEAAVFIGHFRTKYGLSAHLMPQLTPYLGFWSPDMGNKDKTSHLIKALLNVLPPVFFTSICLYHELQDATPWKSKGLHHRTRFTYIIPAQLPDECRSHYSSRLSNHIKNASKKLKVSLHHDINALAEMAEKSFEQQGLKLPYPISLPDKIFKCREACAVIRVATDSEGNVHAAVMTVEDATTVYNLVSGRKADAERGAMALLLDNAIQDALTRGKAFDFEGSSIESIAKFFASFGGKRTSFHHVYGAGNRWINALIPLTGKY